MNKLCIAPHTSARYPATDSRPETVEFAGGAIRYDDPFRWLEEGADREVRAWQEAQDVLAQRFLSSLSQYGTFLARLRRRDFSDDEALPTYAGGKYIHRFVPHGEDLSVVELSDTPDGARRRVLDLNVLQGDEPLQLASYTLSNSGAMAIVAYTSGGHEKPVVELVEVETGRVIDRGLPCERMSSFAWLPDDSGFFYQSQDPADIASGRTLYRVVRDERWSARREDIEPGHFYARPFAAADDRHMLLFVNHLAPRPEYILDSKQGTWKPFLKNIDGIFRGDIVGDRFFAITDDGASGGRLVAIPLSTPEQRDSWQEIIPPSANVLANLMVAGDRVIVLEFVDTYSRLRIFDAKGNCEGTVDLPGKGLVNRIDSFFSFFNVTNTMVRGIGDRVEFLFSTPTSSPAHYAVDLESRALSLITAPSWSFDGQVLDRKTHSADGAEVAYHVIARNDVDLSIPRPTIIIGYGGYNVAVCPGWFGSRWATWIEAGGVLVLGHLRGGGEFGSRWWHQGRLENKQNTFNDLYALAEDLIACGVTTSAQLGVTGGSNGGVMAAVAAVQRPDLFRAVSPEAPVTDLLARSRDKFTMAATQDYGDPSDARMARVLQAWSPYQNVADDTAYPAMLIDCGANDPRCPPWHGHKLAARMQQANASDRPILLRVRTGAGHGAISKGEQIRQSAEVLAFFSEFLGLDP